MSRKSILSLLVCLLVLLSFPPEITFAHPQPGTYTLKRDLIQGGSWFSQNNWPTQTVTVQVQRTLNEAIWRGNQGWVRPLLINASGAIQWGSAPAWGGPIAIGGLPGSGDMQAQNNYRVGNNLIQAFWRGNQGWTRNVPIVNDVIQWGSAPAWGGPIAISGLPGSGNMQAQGDYAVGSTLIQAFWRGNQGWVRNVPIVNGVVQWNQATAWGGPVAISGLPGSGDMQAQDNYVIGNTYWQIIWRSNQQYTRSVPIVGGVVQFGQASGWLNTTAQENLPGSGDVQTQANYVFP